MKLSNINVSAHHQGTATMKPTVLPHLDTIPTVSEKDAAPGVAAIFSDIKQTLGVPFVNLIWRHLATIPGGLEMTWSLAKPLYASQILADSARALREQTRLLDSLSPWPDVMREALGLSASDKSEIVLLLEDYGHANSRALLILKYLHESLSERSLIKKSGSHSVNTSVLVDPLTRLVGINEPQIKPARPLPALSELSESISRLIKILNAFGAPMPSPAEPSLYRHLSYWPSFLSAFWLAVEPMQRQGLLVREAIDIHARATSMVSQWKPVANTEGTIAPDSLNRVLKSLNHFTYAVIGRMIVHGDMMKRMIN